MRCIKAEAGAGVHGQYVPHSASSLSRPSILLVEDDAALRDALTFFLQLEDYSVDAFASGESLLAWSIPNANACLVVDQHLPGITGLETIRRLWDRGVSLPTVMITTHPTPALALKASAYGLWIVEKPLIEDTLTMAIRKALSAAGPDRAPAAP